MSMNAWSMRVKKRSKLWSRRENACKEILQASMQIKAEGIIFRILKQIALRRIFDKIKVILQLIWYEVIEDQPDLLFLTYSEANSLSLS